MKCRISRRLLDRLQAQSAAAGGREICGLLLGEEGRIDEALAVPNIAADPERAFELDPAVHLRRSREARQAGSRVIGHYHSHPGGSPMPSAIDAARADVEGAYWLILTGDACGLWIARKGGEWEGAFDRIELELSETTALQP